MEPRESTAITADRLVSRRRNGVQSETGDRILVIDSSGFHWIGKLVDIWNQSSGRFLLHLRLTESGLSLARTLLFMIAAQIRGAWVVLEIQTEIEPMVESGWSPLLRKIASLSNLVLVTSKTRKALLSSIGINAEQVDIPTVRWQDSARKFSRPIPTLLSVAPLVRESNHSATLRAFKLIKQKYPRAELKIVGCGPLRQELEQFIDSQWLSSVTIIEPTEDATILEILAQSDLYVDSSCCEALPQWTLTALATGLPVVKARINGATERINDRENGLLYLLNNHNELADRVIELIENEPLAQTIARNAIASVTSGRPAEIEEFWRRIYASV
ncbi:MAG: glycosyltransferase family 4 protein [bacterium]|nr:glycosyltransferase family 4 protein [bacterium]